MRASACTFWTNNIIIFIFIFFDKKITINPDIAAFSREVIYTTVIKAFCKVKYREGSKNYENEIEKGLREYELYNNREIISKRKVG